MAISALSSGIKKIVLPRDNAEEAAIIKGVDVYGFDNLSEVVAFLTGNLDVEKYIYKHTYADEDESPRYEVDLRYKRAI